MRAILEKKISIQCFDLEGSKEKEISYEDAKFIYEKIIVLQETGNKSIIKELVGFLERKNIIKIPYMEYSRVYSDNKSYNLFCYIYGAAAAILTILPRHIPVILLSTIFPPLIPLATYITYMIPRVFMPASVFLCILGGIGTVGLLGEWDKGGIVIGGIIVGFIGVKLWISANAIFGVCVAVTAN